MRKLIILILMSCGITLVTNAIGDSPNVAYPSGFRTWQHVKTMLIQPDHPLANPFGGIHHVYANPQAMAGLTSSQYSDGAVFVFDLFNYTDSDSTIVETSRKRIDVMEYDSDRFAATNGWGYTTFVGDSSTKRLEQDVAVACYACHTGAKNSGYVFSKYRQ